MHAQRSNQASPAASSWRGRHVVVTRPAGTARGLARRLRLLDASVLLLPGLSLRGMPVTTALRQAMRAALRDELLLFASPAAVRYAAALMPLGTRATVIALGRGTARALHRHGQLHPLVPQRQDSEGVLALPELQDIRQCRLALIGAPDGRGLLREQLSARGVRLREVHVYRRVAPRLDRRHFDAVRKLPADARVLLSSAEALRNLHALLPAVAWHKLTGAIAVVSSARLEQVARAAGFDRVTRAASAHAADLLGVI